MQMYDDILVPTDGSLGTDRVIQQALTIAERFDASVHTVYAVSLGDAASLEITMDEVRRQLREEGHRATEHVAAEADRLGLDAHTAVVDGDPAQVITDYVDTHGIDLVVMGTHGRSGLDRHLIGSVTERVVRTSPVPVLTVGLDEDAEM
jgi:nucleotide-binding universal stress UspA family protein